MRFQFTALDGAVVIDLDRIEDDRGFFARSWCRREFGENGLDADFVQENVGFSIAAGTMRGLHFQRSPFSEVKLVRCTSGAVWDVAVDLRPGSPTYLRSAGVELSAEHRNMLYVPEGCAHGYLTLTDSAEVRYLTSQYYAADAVGGVRYDDAALGIEWPREVAVVSEQDLSWPLVTTPGAGLLAVIILDRALASGKPTGTPFVSLSSVPATWRGESRRMPSRRPASRSSRSPTARSERAADIFAENRAGIAREITTLAELEDAIARSSPVVTTDPLLVCRAEGVDVVMDATGEVDLGLEVSLAAIAHGKARRPRERRARRDTRACPQGARERAGVVITNTDGDEPGVTMNLFRYVSTIGLRPVLAGNIKGFIDPHRTPETQRAFAESVGQGPKMITSFADGTKLSMETTLVANATGFGVAQRGMRGHRCDHVKDVLSFYEPEELLDGGYVDYVLGAQPGRERSSSATASIPSTASTSGTSRWARGRSTSSIRRGICPRQRPA